jgi:hypothetical protein
MYNHISSWSDHGSLNEPGQAKADQDIKDVAPDGVGDSHVTVTYRNFLLKKYFQKF